MIKIEVAQEKVITKTNKAGHPYYKQPVYAHLVDRDGQPKKYPEEMLLFLTKDERGNPISYPPGFYKLLPSSLRIGRFGDLEIGFINLEPIKKATA